MGKLQNCIVSIVVPIYKGFQYIDSIIHMYEENVKNMQRAGDENLIELILVNDYPDEKIELTHKGVRVINNEKNHGIQGSRVIGLNACLGQYVLMLDQDDKISADFVLRQIKKIGDADLIICNGIHNNWQIFQSNADFESKMSDVGINYIVSPGQVMIRKSSIPEEWKRDIMSCAGADDYYLWILMMNNGAVFAYNDTILFEHVKHNDNTSNDMLVMKLSNEELIKKVEKYVKNGEYKRKLVEGIKKTIDENIKQIKIEKVFERIAADKDFINHRIEINNCDCITIYGFGNMGQKIYKLLQENGTQIVCVLDKKEPNESMKKQYNIKYPSKVNLDAVGDNELVIVTPIKPCECIKKFLLENGIKHVETLLEMARMINEGNIL